MKIAVISDLHLGNGGRLDEFGHDDAEFLRFLDFLEGNFERVVLAGDVWETLYCKSPRQQVRELRMCREAHKDIAERFERPAYQYLHGNHDIVSGNILGAPEALHLEADGTRILFTHGHQLDWVVSRARWLSELIVWAGAWVMRMGLRPLKAVSERVETLLRGESRDRPEKDRFQLASIQMATQSDADIVVTGHTHNGIVTHHGDRLFMNSGSCSGGAFSWLSLDTKAGAYALNNGW
ncbi:MAG: serine/threonine protein phosphatase [Deltaproteobacteria bacterium]|nr:MAG: serine/threonine protein phosphatase [Deltaproteobacteria bacterium]